MSGLFRALENQRMPTHPASNGNRWFIRVIAGLTVAAVAFMFAHIVQPSHAVSKERMDNFSRLQLEQNETSEGINDKLGACLLQFAAQAEILKSIDRRLAALEP